jgi:hypothetical protein
MVIAAGFVQRAPNANSNNFWRASARTPLKIGKRRIDAMLTEQENRVVIALEVAKALSSYNYGGFVYIITCDDRYVKIGFVRGGEETIKNRIATLQAGNPFDLRLVHKLPGGKPLEQALHGMFATYLHRGEWFKVDGDLRVFLSRITELGEENNK